MGEGEGGMIWENGIKTCIISCKKQIAHLGSMQDTKPIHRNHLDFYILTMKNQKEKLRNQSHSPLQQKELSIWNKLT